MGGLVYVLQLQDSRFVLLLLVVVGLYEKH
jgi:hypothetical protein